MTDNQNETALTVMVDNTALRNKTANMTTIQRSESEVIPGSHFCRELRKGTKTTGRCITSQKMTKLLKRQAMPIIVENNNKEQNND